MDFNNKKMTKLKTFLFNSRLCQDNFKEESSASTQLKLTELGTSKLKLVLDPFLSCRPKFLYAFSYDLFFKQVDLSILIHVDGSSYKMSLFC